MRSGTDEDDSSKASFADQLNGLASSDEPAQSAVSATPRTATAPARRTATPSKDSKKDNGNDVKGVTAGVMLQTANPQALPLHIQLSQRDGNEDQPSDSPDTRQSGNAASAATGLTLEWNAATASAAANVEDAATGTRDGEKVRSTESDKPAASRRSDGNGAAAAKPEMAFAARVQPATSAQNATNDSRRASDTQLAAASASALRKASDSDATDASNAKDAARPSEPAAALQHVAAVFEQASRTTDAPAPQRTEAAGQTAETAPVHAESPTKPAAPLKDISLEVTQAGAEKVEIRVVQQSGEVHVAVRTGDTDLTHGLRQGLTELVGKLEDNGYRADTWRPGGSTAAPAALSQSQDSQSASGQSHYGDSANRQNGSQHNGGQQNQNQNQYNRPRWVEALESSLTGEGESTGETNGIVS
jgi:hypothetical protein